MLSQDKQTWMQTSAVPQSVRQAGKALCPTFLCLAWAQSSPSPSVWQSILWRNPCSYRWVSVHIKPDTSWSQAAPEMIRMKCVSSDSIFFYVLNHSTLQSSHINRPLQKLSDWGRRLQLPGNFPILCSLVHPVQLNKRSCNKRIFGKTQTCVYIMELHACRSVISNFKGH